MSNFKMIDVGEKSVTRRRAVATGRFKAKIETIQRVLAGDLPKGDVLKLAEVAGIMAAKRTPDLLPLCHPLILDSVRVSFQEVKSKNGIPEIEARCEVICHGKTGVEMEALTGVQIALLCIYDLTKNIDPVLEISDVRLLEKEGGKSGHWLNPDVSPSVDQEKNFKGVRAAVLTVSDRCSRGEAEDHTGPKIRSVFREEGSAIIADAVVADEVNEIRELVQGWVSNLHLDVIVITGGTGISPRDVTPEAMHEIWDRTIPGFWELFRRKGAASTPMAWLSRAEAGLVGKTLIFLLPGSPGGVDDGLAILKDVLPHTLAMVRGEKHG